MKRFVLRIEGVMTDEWYDANKEKIDRANTGEYGKMLEEPGKVYNLSTSMIVEEISTADE